MNWPRQQRARTAAEALERIVGGAAVPRLRFQSERLAILFRQRSRFTFGLRMLFHRFCFLTVLLLIWIGHRRALRAGGYRWRRFWRTSWEKMNVSWRQMDPHCYSWPAS